MNLDDLLIAAGESINLQTEAEIVPVCKFKGVIHEIQDSSVIFDKDNIEYPLAVVECKPVFIGDKLWSNEWNNKLKVDGISADKKYFYHITKNNERMFVNVHDALWEKPKPKPKTVMIELQFEDVEYWTSFNLGRLPETSAYNIASNRFFDACKKAMSNVDN